MKKTASTLAVIAALGLGLSACGGQSSSQAGHTRSATPCLVDLGQGCRSDGSPVGGPTAGQEADHQRRLDAAADDVTYNAEVERWNTTYPNLP
jgi:hypothetical protein